MNNRGFLLGEETVKIVIAVLAIALLIYVLVSLYFSQTEKNKLLQAETDLDYIVEQIEISKSTDIKPIVIYSPAGWLILTYQDEGDLTSCNGNCICICPDAWLWQNQATKCSKDGVCRKIEDKLDNVNIEIDKLNLEIKYKDGVVYLKND